MADNSIPQGTNPLVAFLIRPMTVLIVILLNAGALYLHAFPAIEAKTQLFAHIDYACTVYFVVEAMLKIRTWSWRGYTSDGWNRVDFIIVFFSLPSLLTPFIDMHVFALLPLLRLGRLARFFRLMRLVPNAEMIWKGVKRAMKASIAVVLVLVVLNFVFALGATMLFGGKDAPAVAKEHFGNPLRSGYTMFKVFTIEGWYEIPDRMAREKRLAGPNADPRITDEYIMHMRLYFVLAVLVGGILGLSIANAVFVDEMTADNTDKVEAMVESMTKDLERFREEVHADQRQVLLELQEEWAKTRKMLERLEGGRGA